MIGFWSGLTSSWLNFDSYLVNDIKQHWAHNPYNLVDQDDVGAQAHIGHGRVGCMNVCCSGIIYIEKAWWGPYWCSAVC